MGNLLSGPSAPRARLRELLAAPGPLVAPGAYDALSARLVEQAGFDVVYMTGFGTTASLVGRPDVGLLSGTEMVDNARRIAAAVDVPVIAIAGVTAARVAELLAAGAHGVAVVGAVFGADDTARATKELLTRLEGPR